MYFIFTFYFPINDHLHTFVPCECFWHILLPSSPSLSLPCTYCIPPSISNKQTKISNSLPLLIHLQLQKHRRRHFTNFLHLKIVAFSHFLFQPLSLSLSLHISRSSPKFSFISFNFDAFLLFSVLCYSLSLSVSLFSFQFP